MSSLKFVFPPSAVTAACHHKMAHTNNYAKVRFLIDYITSSYDRQPFLSVFWPVETFLCHTAINRKTERCFSAQILPSVHKKAPRISSPGRFALYPHYFCFPIMRSTYRKMLRKSRYICSAPYMESFPLISASPADAAYMAFSR